MSDPPAGAAFALAACAASQWAYAASSAAARLPVGVCSAPLEYSPPQGSSPFSQCSWLSASGAEPGLLLLRPLPSLRSYDGDGPLVRRACTGGTLAGEATDRAGWGLGGGG